MTTKIDLSVVVPVFNGGDVLKKTLPAAIKELSQLNLAYELILVDDGSTDSTAQVLEMFKHNIRAIYLKPNQGKGAAVRQGLLAAQGNFLFFTDVDFPYGVKTITDNVKWLREGYDLVIGDRNLQESGYHVKMSRSRHLLSQIASALTANIILPGESSISDTQCGFKGLSAAAAKKLLPLSRINGFSFDIELLHLAIKHQFKIKQVPVILRENTTSSVHIVRDSIKSGLDLIRIKYHDFCGFYDV